MHSIPFTSVLNLPLLLDFHAASPDCCNSSSHEIHAVQHDHRKAITNIVLRNNVSSLCESSPHKIKYKTS